MVSHTVVCAHFNGKPQGQELFRKCTTLYDFCGVNAVIVAACGRYLCVLESFVCLRKFEFLLFLMSIWCQALQQGYDLEKKSYCSLRYNKQK